MTNRIALALGLIVSALVLADLLLNGAAALVFLGRRLLALIEALAFWR